MNVAAFGLPPQPVRMRFVGTEQALFKLLLRATLLLIPTAGFYRFWLVTTMRRHLWSHTAIGEDTFEYTGTGRELMIGFLIAMAVIVPINILYFVLALEAERVLAFASVPLFLLFYAFGHYAFYRARRYRLTRTIFRGVRFWMTGSGFAYLGRAALWDLVTLLTLGFAYAWRQAALERYKMRHTCYGTVECTFVGSGWTLFRRAGWMWAICLVVAAALGVFLFIQDWVSAIVLGVPLAIATVLLVPVLQAIELRWWLEGIRVGPVEAASDLTIGAVFRCYLKTIGFWMVYSMVGGIMISLAIGIAVGIVTAIFGTVTFFDENGALPQMGGGFVAMLGAGLIGGLVYIAFLLGFGLITRLFLDRGLWAAVANSVTLTHLEALDHVSAAAGALPTGVGEGLLDALDLGGGF